MTSKLFVTTCTILAVSSTAPPVHGQPAISGPTSGYAFVAGEFRPILGIPGSAYLGPPISYTAKFGRVAPNGISALTFGQDGVHYIPDLGQPNIVPIETRMTPTDAFWSDDSSAAALYSSVTQSLQFFTLSSPSARMRLPIRLEKYDVVGAPLAVDPAARLAAVCSGGDLAVVEARGVMKTSLRCDGLSIGVFAAHTRLYVAGNGRVLEIEKWENGGAVKTLLENDGVVPVAAGVCESAAGQLLLLADASANRLYVFNTVTGQQDDRFDLDYSPSSLDLSGPGLFLLNRARRQGEPLLLFQLQPKHAVSFVPVGE